MYDLVAIGDTTLDTFLELEDASVLCGLDKNNCKLCMNYAEKIPVKSINQAIGGNAANVAVGVSRLGLKTALVSVLGDDPAGNQVMNMLEKENVNHSLVALDKNKKSNYSTVLNLNGERTILIFHEQRNYCRNLKLPSAKIAYVTSMKDGWECMLGKEGLIDWVEKNHLIVGYNPGTYQIRAGINDSKSLLKHTEYLFLNKEEAQKWLNNNSSDFKILGSELMKYGPKNIIITDSINGSYAYTNNQIIFTPSEQTDLIEATGAGDAYASGFISAIFYGKTIKDAMHWGAQNAASVIGNIGSQAGLLKRDKIK